MELLALLHLCAFLAFASDVDGTIVIKRKLTRSKVTASSSAYQRGVSVDLAQSNQTESIAPEYQRVVVYLEGDLPPQQPVTAVMEQRNRQFVPDTLAIPVGSQVSFPNLDPIFHNVFSLSKTRVVTFQKPGVVFVNCHLHPNMSAAIRCHNQTDGWRASIHRVSSALPSCHLESTRWWPGTSRPATFASRSRSRINPMRRSVF